VSAQFTGHGSRVLHQLEGDTGKFFHFTGSEGLPLDHFDVVKEGSNDEILEEAVPFREGDEVLVHIVEPHMYNVDDAVAKIDGYIISVTDGGPHVGSKRLVRIEEAGRTAAIATLVDSDNGAEGDDGVESSPRRRGRRGGRRRSAAQAASSE
jgi:ribonuclease G